MLENLALLIVVLMVVVIFFVLFVDPLIKKSQKERAFRREQETLLEQRQAERCEKRVEWNRRVNHAKRHLVGADWRDPAGKIEFILELWGEVVPQYLWYEFDGLTAEEEAELRAICWPKRLQWDIRHFGDIEGHRNLRLRNAHVLFAEIRLSTGKVLPLDQVGYVDFWNLGEEGFPEGVVVFSAKGFYPQNDESVK